MKPGKELQAVEVHCPEQIGTPVGYRQKLSLKSVTDAAAQWAVDRKLLFVTAVEPGSCLLSHQ